MATIGSASLSSLYLPITVSITNPIYAYAFTATSFLILFLIFSFFVAFLFLIPFFAKRKQKFCTDIAWTKICTCTYNFWTFEELLSNAERILTCMECVRMPQQIKILNIFFIIDSLIWENQFQMFLYSVAKHWN